ncbi:MAG TPA: DUF4177 domain-containing protein [Thermoanaerobaculia bacterium]|nr:DUF4177 domain-containing protein [Thermoanaerobaculia bacterium]HUM30048.1 DUF4177 domain-containing protein [Thermoanaerobaculia bacterium]HXK68263.1 DUF4177 domain-containing protein [Thermoanaerobaculia bacterium]
MKTWEYRIVNLRSENYQIRKDYEAELNGYGQDGWELVGLTSVNFKSGATDHIGLIFKREKA